jgi:hypothetical protein
MAQFDDISLQFATVTESIKKMPKRNQGLKAGDRLHHKIPETRFFFGGYEHSITQVKKNIKPGQQHFF